MGLVVEILRGIRDQADADAGPLDEEEQEQLVHAVHRSTFPTGPETCQQRVAQEDRQTKNAMRTDTAQYLDSTSRKIQYDCNSKDR